MIEKFGLALLALLHVLIPVYWLGSDLAIRCGVLTGLAVTGVLELVGRIEMPPFNALKLLILAAAISPGLRVRRQLVPLFPAIAALRREGASPA